MKATKFDPLQKLLAMPLKERLNGIAKDVRARRKKFHTIDAWALAEALGVPDADKPGDGWWFAHYAEKVTAEDYASNCDGLVELLSSRLEDKIPAKRLQDLLEKADRFDHRGGKKFAALKAKERKLVEDEIAQEDLEANQMNGMNCFARYRLEAPSGSELWFEASIEDDGTCIHLLTPYEEAAFVDLKTCVCDGWPG